MWKGLVFLILFSSITALKSGTRDYLDEYFEKVVGSFKERLFQNGIASLPVEPVSLDINRTISGTPLLGFVNYTNGVVIEIADIVLEKEGHRGEPEDDGVHLYYQAKFLNMTILADVSADLNPLGSAKGSAELLFLNTSISISFDKNYTEGTTNVLTLPYATMGPATTYLPVSDVMDAAAYLGRLELGYRLLWDQVASWCNSTFTPLVTTITEEIEFPMFPPQLEQTKLT